MTQRDDSHIKTITYDTRTHRVVPIIPTKSMLDAANEILKEWFKNPKHRKTDFSGNSVAKRVDKVTKTKLRWNAMLSAAPADKENVG